MLAKFGRVESLIVQSLFTLFRLKLRGWPIIGRLFLLSAFLWVTGWSAGPVIASAPVGHSWGTSPQIFTKNDHSTQKADFDIYPKILSSFIVMCCFL